MRIRLSIVTVLSLLVAAACAGDSADVISSTTTAPTHLPTTATPPTPAPAATTTAVVPTTTPPTIATTVATTTTATTTEPPDTEPPSLAVTWPSAGDTVDERAVAFVGRTEPGARVVAAGRYDVMVESDGDWSIVLVLNPGENVATFAATDPAGNTTEVRHPVHYRPPIVLRPEGLGAVSFGATVDDAMAVLSDMLGAPDWEEIQIATDVDRSVRWDAVDLYLQFTYPQHFGTAPPHPTPDGPMLHYYLTRSPLFTTPAGVGVGSTVDELEAAYPNVEFRAPGSGCNSEWEFTIEHSSGWIGYLIFGWLNRDPSEAGSRITGIGAGLDRTPC